MLLYSLQHSVHAKANNLTVVLRSDAHIAVLKRKPTKDNKLIFSRLYFYYC